jgi:serine phosphatase RsbU (regulator of sigma subunit)
VYQPGTGLLAGDFYDVHPLSEHRLAVVIGDVTGHGLEPSITAFQAKYLLRVFLRQFRDPAQALEELNATMTAQARAEEFVSLMVAVFDAEAGTVRYASAGHPTGWFWHDREVHPLRATGPLLMLDPAGTFHSRELAAEPDDVLVVYTDGLSEARAGDAIFGEDRVAQYVRRDPGVDTDVLCKSLVEAARDFASSPITDDIAVLAIRRL